jgi:hypothetical protein
MIWMANIKYYLQFPDCHFSYKCEGTWRKFVVFVKGTLHTWSSLLEIGSDIIPTPSGWDGNYAYLYLCKNPPTIDK